MESSNEVINMTLVLSITLHKGQYKNITCFYKVRSQTEKFQNQRRKKPQKQTRTRGRGLKLERQRWNLRKNSSLDGRNRLFREVGESQSWMGLRHVALGNEVLWWTWWGDGWTQSPFPMMIQRIYEINAGRSPSSVVHKNICIQLKSRKDV